jgi:hypothetical protein
LYRLAGSADPFQAIPSPLGPGAVIGPNVTAVGLNRSHIPLVSVDVAWEYKVLSSFGSEGPFEDVGARITLAVTNRAPQPPTKVRLLSKSSSSVTVSWFPSSTKPLADYFVVEVLENRNPQPQPSTLEPGP